MQTNKVFSILAVLAVVAFGIYYYLTTAGDTGKTETYVAPTPTQQTETTSAPLAQPEAGTKTSAAATIAISNFSFSPSTLTIKSGTKVTWTNNDGAPHTVTSDSGSTLHSETLSPGQSFSFTFSQVGSVAYHCSIHPGMQGTIVVQK